MRLACYSSGSLKPSFRHFGYWFFGMAIEQQSKIQNPKSKILEALMAEVDEKSQLLLNIMQDDVPLVDRPYRALGEKIGLSEADVVDRVTKLKADKVLRQVSTIFDTRSLGYQSSLVACKAPEGKADQVAEVLNQH